MVFLIYTILTFISISLLFLLLIFCFLIISIFIGKSMNDPSYPPVKGTVFNQLFYFNKLYDYLASFAAKSPTYRLLGPEQSEVYTTDPRNVEHILKTNFDKYSRGQHEQDIMTDLFGEGIFAVNGEKWKQQRKLASVEFSARVLRDFSCSVFRRNASKLVRAVSGLMASAGVLHMQDLFMRSTLDSIFEVGFGVELNCLDGSSKEGNEFLRAFDESNALIYWRYVDPFWKLKRFFDIGSEAPLKKNVKVIDQFVNNLIRKKRKLLAERHDSVSSREDILSRFLMEGQKNPGQMNDKYLRDIILSFIVAGKDTSANTLSWFFYMLSKNPLVQEKIVQEIRDVIGDKANDNESNIDDFVAAISDEVLERTHYLHAALSETLRLYPAVPVDGRCADIDDTLPDGFKVKKGDIIFYMAYAMARMPYIWGEDAQDFRPERWIKDGIFQPESPFKFVTFHAGPRICLGKEFAYRQMKILSIALLRFFRFGLADNTEPVNYKTMFTLHIDGGLPLCAVSRTAS
ncbi:cytochrome P450 704C1 [Morus notabilis]|uniref:cytochrome P450 704C1 n=1 Tax=Morus notabilis TaxID=981085 RepID=UPI000CED1EDB|nr:cytochrome P450 704C1 [Morus notabilis]